MSKLLISSFCWAMWVTLRLLTKNERCERIAQAATQKWATMSDLLRSHRGNERSWANHSGHSSKMSDIEWFALFLWAMWVNHSGRSPKMSDVSESLRSLTKNERSWANCSGCSSKMSKLQIFLSKLLIRTFLGQKKSDSLGNPMSEFPALVLSIKSV